MAAMFIAQATNTHMTLGQQLSLLAILMLMPWMIQRIAVYTTALFGDLGRYAR